MPEVQPTCNICGSTVFTAKGNRAQWKCGRCGATQRARLMRLVMDRIGFPKPGMRVLHLAPEKTLYTHLRKILGKGYETADFDPSLFPHAPETRKIDLTTDAVTLPTAAYDAIIHLHVMEHIPCNITAVLWHLHRALKPDGMQICCIPIVPRKRYEESLEKLDADDATARFGQYDHVRRFGAADLQLTLGMLFELPEHYDLTRIVPEDVIRSYGFEEHLWRGWGASSILVLPKDSMRLR